MTKLEEQFYYSFLAILIIFFWSGVWHYATDLPPQSFYYPTGILRIPYDKMFKANYVLKWILLVQLFFGIFKINLLRDSKIFISALILQFTFLLSNRFSYYHFPHLEMFPVLALIGILIGTNLRDKIQKACSLVIIIYFFSGLSKVRFSGLSWMDPKSVQQMILYSFHFRRNEFGSIMSLNEQNFLFQNSMSLSILGFCGLFYELILPIFIFVKRTRKLFFWLTLFFHIFIWLVLNIYSTSVLFPLYLFACSAYFNLENSNEENKI